MLNKLNQAWSWLDGKKTNIVALASVLYGLSGLVGGYMSWQEAVNYVFGGVGAFSFRDALRKLSK